MDPGTALSVATLVYDMTKELYDYYRSWKNCEKDVEDMRIQLLWLHKAFKLVRDTLRNPELSESRKELVYDAIGDCNDAANELRNLLDKLRAQAPPQTALEIVKAHGRRACYPFKKSTIAAVAENVEHCRDTLHLAVDLLGFDTTVQTLDKLHEIDRTLIDGLGNIDKSLSSLQLQVNSFEDTALNNKMRVDNSFQAMLSWLSQKDHSQELHNLRSAHTNGTSRWFLDSPDFLAWLQGTENTIHCSGHPGTGKSVIAALVVDHLLDTVSSPTTPVVYLFFNYKSESEQTASHCLLVLLRQLVNAMVGVPQIVQDMQDRHLKKNTRPSFEELAEVLVSLVRTFDRLHVVVDALDECDGKTRRLILPIVAEMQSHGNVKLLATSRPLPELCSELSAGLTMKVRASQIDLTNHLRSRMDELSRCVQNREDLQDKIVSAIVAAADGVFLLARLHMDSLRDKRTPRAVLSAIEQLPTGSGAYDSAYEIAMERIQSQPKGDRDLAEKVLMWILCAQTTLTTIQLQHALAVNSSSCEPDEDDMELVDEIVLVCTGLVIVDDRSGTVRLVHHTAQEYLGRTRSEWFPWADPELALRCLWYLCLPEFSNGPCSSDEALNARLSSYPLYEYATKYWGVHYRNNMTSSEYRQKSDLDGKAMDFLLVTSRVLSSAQVMFTMLPADAGYSERFPADTSALHVAAHFGLASVIQLLLDAGHDVEANDGYGQTPVWYAAEVAQEEALRVLLDHGADANAQGGSYSNAISFASFGGYVEVAQMLLDHGADVNTTVSSFSSPLYAASVGAHLELMQLLLNYGADVNWSGPYGTALQTTAGGGELEAVRLLLSNGADANAQSGGNGNALYIAARGNHADVVSLLIDNGADVDIRGGAPGNALFAAFKAGSFRIVKLLLDQGAYHEGRDGTGRAAASWAAIAGSPHLVGMLLRDCSGVHEFQGPSLLKQTDALGCSMIHHFVMGRSLEGVKMVLDLGVNVNTADSQGWTALHWSAYFDQGEIAALLKDSGASVHLEDHHGCTAHEVALLVGADTVADLLCDPAIHDDATVPTCVAATLRGQCDSCMRALVGSQYHCLSCDEYDLCYRCYMDAATLHPHHGFDDSFRYQSESAIAFRYF